MATDTLVNILQLYGFPAAMCIWFMIRLERRLNQIESTNHKQIVIMTVITHILGDLKTLGMTSEDYFSEITDVDLAGISVSSESERNGNTL